MTAAPLGKSALMDSARTPGACCRSAASSSALTCCNCDVHSAQSGAPAQQRNGCCATFQSAAGATTSPEITIESCRRERAASEVDSVSSTSSTSSCESTCVCNGGTTLFSSDASPQYREVQWNELQNLRYVGRGAMCRIYSANLGGRKVAVKIARDDCKDPSAAEHDLEVEMHVLQHMRHRNIIQLLGAGVRACGNQQYRFLVLEYLELGTLADGIETGVMQGHQQSTLAKLVKGAKRNKHSQFVIMLERALEMAEAMEYMHYGLCGGATVVLHRDLKPDNVGFAADGTLKLFDFGLARCQRRAENNEARYSMTGNTGTVRYMPPEVARGQRYNEKVDVYSFGLMLWEMLQYRRVFSGIGVREFYADVLVGGRRPTPDPSWSPELVALMKGCWSVDCNKRPCFKSIVATLRSVLAQESQNAQPAAPSAQQASSQKAAPFSAITATNTQDASQAPLATVSQPSLRQMAAAPVKSVPRCQSLTLDVTRAPTAISLVSSDAQEVEVASPSHASSGRYSTGMLGQLRRRMSFAVTSKRSLQRQSAGLR
eukprot:TRINITY_DN4694_c0_g1_i1.p1 TRINITY_DN4694_c0_g1~~TRINITY_DN4694_c0_g1_i1.p1  ORF type:complete len:544 (-),score=114.49 TRINITY_DN4694_c0_g1_i1:612-2243(-)